MSRTDAHRPARVHLSEHAVAYHDHTGGPCDLPDLDDVVHAGQQRRGRPTRCSWWLPVGYQHEHSPFSKYKGDRSRRPSVNKKADIAARLKEM